jgi:uncharacterized protein (UPF0335 family)
MRIVDLEKETKNIPNDDKEIAEPGKKKGKHTAAVSLIVI